MSEEKPRVLITLTEKEYELVQEHVIKKFQNQGIDVISSFSNAKLPETEVIKLIQDVDGYIFGLEDITRNVLLNAKKLKAVCKYGIGTDNVDKKTAEELGIQVTNCPGLNSLAVAELTVGTMLGLARNIPELDNTMKNKTWDSILGTELTGKTIGIIGFGNVGQHILKLLSGFNMNVLVYDLLQDQKLAYDLGYEYASLEQIYTLSDYISLNIPLTSETRNLITMNELKMMKKNAFLINMARGGIVNEEDLISALSEQIIGGAAIDAFQEEPTKAYGLVNHPKVIALPHIGASTIEATVRIGNCAYQNIFNIITGKAPLHRVHA